MKRRLRGARPRTILAVAALSVLAILAVAAASASLHGLPSLDLADQPDVPANAAPAKAPTGPRLAVPERPGPSRASPGPGQNVIALPGGVHPVTATLTVGSAVRTYDVFAPPTGTAKVPALVVLHGSRVSTGLEESRDGLVELALAGKALVVYPVGFRESWNAGACCGPAHAAGMNDIGFLTSLVHKVAVDPGVTAVYLVGYSNGGRMAFDLVCSQPKLVSAFVVVSAVPVVPCPTGPPVSLLEMVGTVDPILSYDASVPRHIVNGYVEPTVTEATGLWRRRDGCSAQSFAARTGILHLETWNHCSGGSVVELGTFVGAGHAWPAGGGATPSGADVAWTFLTTPHSPSSPPPRSPSPHVSPAPPEPLVH